MSRPYLKESKEKLPSPSLTFVPSSNNNSLSKTKTKKISVLTHKIGINYYYFMWKKNVSKVD
jgi:hypothetical protein